MPAPRGARASAGLSRWRESASQGRPRRRRIPPRGPAARRDPRPFTSLEASSRERLLAETAEAWYHFGDAADVRDLIERVDDSLDEGGQRLAAALIFAVLSSDDTNLAHSLNAQPSQSRKRS